MFESRIEVDASALEATDAALHPIQIAAKQHNIHMIVGFLEKSDDRVFNSAMLVGPSGILTCYRKQHLPLLGADRFVSPGDANLARVVNIGALRALTFPP